ncbi:MAG: NosD domain-containing protein [Roseburia intestinalis]
MWNRITGSEEVSVKNAVISNNAKSGVAVASSKRKSRSGDATVNNNGTDSKDYGINLNNVDTATVTNVTASSNASHGLLITASKGIHVSESTFNTSVGGYGIYCNDKTEAVFSVICGKLLGVVYQWASVSKLQ